MQLFNRSTNFVQCDAMPVVTSAFLWFPTMDSSLRLCVFSSRNVCESPCRFRCNFSRYFIAHKMLFSAKGANVFFAFSLGRFLLLRYATVFTTYIRPVELKT